MMLGDEVDIQNMLYFGMAEAAERRRPRAEPPIEVEILTLDEVGTTAVSALYRTESQSATKLHVFDVMHKLKHPGNYDIGGTYVEQEPDTWFFFTTTPVPGNNYLLSLFVCHRRTGNLNVGVSNSNELTFSKKKEKGGQSMLPDTLTWQSFRTSQANENYYLRTFCFSETDVKAMNLSTLVIPIRIESGNASPLNNDFIKKIKLSHDFGNILSKQEKSDFVLLSASQKQYPVHKIFLAAHSPVLRDIIKNKSSGDAQLFLDINDNDMEYLLEFIYTGTIKDILQKDCVKLLEIADRFQLKNLFFLTQFALGDQINIDNAIEIASIAEKYKMEKLQTIVFSFIKNNPKVLETEGWKNLNDVNLAKKLFQFKQTKRD